MYGYSPSSQICLDVASSGFNKGRHIRGVGYNGLVSNIEGQDVVIFAKGINGCNVLIKKVGGPCRGSTIDRTVERE